MTDSITITAGRPNRTGAEKDFSGPDGSYELILSAVSAPVTERSTMPDAKGDGTWTHRTWTFAINDGGEFDGQVIDLRANAGSAGPKSKQYGIVTALAGKAPPVGTTIEIPKLVGRRCLGQIATNDSDYPYIATLMPLPASRRAAPAPAAVPVEIGRASCRERV